jgi:peptidyl-tRNA hydrolase
MKFLVDHFRTTQEHNDKFTKICLGVSSLEELLEIEAKAKESGLVVKVIEDSGLTEFSGIPTITCLAIGPDYSSKIDPITRDLKPL